MAVSWQTKKLNEMLGRFETALKHHSSPVIVKELVFNRVRVYSAKGYCGSVAFSKALKDHNFLHIH